jgi:hypothetical protein
MKILAPLIIILGGAALAIWLAFAIISGVWSALKVSFDEASKSINANRKRREEEKKQAAIAEETRQIEDFRKSQLVQIIGVPNLALLNQISGQLSEIHSSIESLSTTNSGVR